LVLLNRLSELIHISPFLLSIFLSSSIIVESQVKK
jgi:hypothetical protein